MQQTDDLFGEQALQRLQTFICLVPVVGFFPSVWLISRHRGSRDQQNASRLAIVLTVSWLTSYLLLNSTAQISAGSPLQLLILSSFLTSGYFLVSLWLMARLWQGKPIRLPGVSRLGDRLP